MPLPKPCLQCHQPTTYGSYCKQHSLIKERLRVKQRAQRLGTTAQRYGPDYQRARAQLMKDEPWCHWPDHEWFLGDERNPLTIDHELPTSQGGGVDDGLRVLCRYHNSRRGAAER